MALSDFVTISVSIGSAGITQAGYGTPMFISYEPTWTERSRTYTSLAAVVADGFGTSTYTYYAAARLFGALMKPPQIIIGRGALKPTQRFAITPVAVDSTAYKVNINGTTLTFTSGVSTTVTLIIAGIKSAIDALALPVTVSDQTTYLRILANTPGYLLDVEVPIEQMALLAIAQDHADPGIAADIVAINNENNTWYAMATTFNSKDLIAAAALQIETMDKLYVAQTQDSAVITTAISGADDIAEALKALAYNRTALIYHTDTYLTGMADLAWLGRVLPIDTGKDNWAYKALVGVTPVALTSTHKVNLKAKNCNWYQAERGVGITFPGITAGGALYVDDVRNRDWIQITLQEELFNAQITVDKFGMSDPGLLGVQNIGQGVLDRATDKKILRANPEALFVVPLVSAIPLLDRTARIASGISFSGYLEGAINTFAITGLLSK